MNKIVFSLFILILTYALPSYTEAKGIEFSLTGEQKHVIIKPGGSFSIQAEGINLGDPTYMHFEIFESKYIQSDFEKRFSSSLPIKFLLNGQLNSTSTVLSKFGDHHNVTIFGSVPENTKEGDYYFSYSLSILPNSKELTSEDLKINPQLIKPLIITVTKSGQIEEKGKIEIFSTKEDSEDKLGINLTIANTGKNIVQISGNISTSFIFQPDHNFDFPVQYIPGDSNKNVAEYIKIDRPRFGIGRISASANIGSVNTYYISLIYINALGYFIITIIGMVILSILILIFILIKGVFLAKIY